METPGCCLASSFVVVGGLGRELRVLLMTGFVVTRLAVAETPPTALPVPLLPDEAPGTLLFTPLPLAALGPRLAGTDY